MATFTDDKNQKLADLERLLEGKANTLGANGSVMQEPWRRQENIILGELWRSTPSAAGGLIAPDYDAYGTTGAVGTRYEAARLHSYVPSGTSNLNTQTFVVVSSAVASNDPAEIDAVRRTNLIPPAYSPNKSHAAEVEPHERGFQLALYPAKSGGGLDQPLVADLDKGPIPLSADPSAVNGAGDDASWYVDYANGIVRLTAPMLHGSTGVFNPNNVYGDNEGLQDTDAYGTPVLFATYYQYSGSYGTVDANNFIVVGDGYNSNGEYEGKSQSAIQSALDALPSNGGTVFVKEGTYDLFTDSVVLRDNRRVVGLGGAQITAPPSSAAFSVVGTNTVIEGFEIRTSESSTGGSCIELSGSSPGALEVQNCQIKNNILYCKHDAYGVEFSPNADDVTFRNIKIRDNVFKNEYDTDALWAAVGQAGGLITSPDGIAWTQRTFAGSPAAAFNNIAHDGKGIWIAVGASGSVQRSYDAITWEDISSDVFSTSDTWSAVAADGSGTWVIAGLGSGSDQTMVYSTDNTATWNTITQPYDVYDVAHDGAGMWCLVGGQALLQTSPDGITWTTRTSPTEEDELYDVVHDYSGRWMVAADTAGVYTSTDGITWSNNAITSGSIYSVTYNGAVWIAVGSGGEVQTSEDGINWVARSSGTSSNLNHVHSNGQGMVIAAGSGFIKYSSDNGITWNDPSTLPITPIFNDVFYPMHNPVYIGERYEDGYSGAWEKISIIDNQFDNVVNGVGKISIDDHVQSINELVVNNNAGDARFDLTALDSGRITNSDFSNNAFSSINIGNFARSALKNNKIRGNVDIYNSNTTGIAVEQSVLSDNIVLGDFIAGNAMTSGTVFKDTHITENVIDRSIAFGAALTGTTAGFVMDGTTFSGNKHGYASGGMSCGNASRDEHTPTYNDSVISNNTMEGSLTLSGQALSSTISGNQIDSGMTTDSIANCTISDGYFGFTLAIDTVSTSGTSVAESVISNNVMASTLTVGASVTDGTVLKSSHFLNNVITTSAIFGGAVTGSTAALVLDDSSVSGNRTLTDGQVIQFGNASRDMGVLTYIDSCINDNHSSGHFRLYGLQKDVTISGNHVDQTTTFGAMRNCVVSDGYFGGGISCGATITSGTGLEDSSIHNNLFSGSLTICGNLTGGTALKNCVVSDNNLSAIAVTSIAIANNIENGDVVVDSIIDGNTVPGGSLSAGSNVAGYIGGHTLLRSSVSNNMVGAGGITFGDQLMANNTENYRDSRICDNICTGALIVAGMSVNSNISNNTISGTTDIDALRECVVSDGYFGSAFRIATVQTSGTAVEGCKISGNVMSTSCDIGTAITDGRALDESIFSYNIISGLSTIGNTSVSDLQINFEKTIFSNNVFGNALTVNGQLKDCSFSENNAAAAVTVGALRNCTISDGYYGGNLTICGTSTAGDAIAESIISGNIFGGALDIGDSITDGNIVAQSNISSNVFSGAFSLGESLTSNNVGLALDHSNFSGNTCSSTMDFAASGRTAGTDTYSNSTVSNNVVTGATAFNGSFRASIMTGNNWSGGFSTGNTTTEALQYTANRAPGSNLYGASLRGSTPNGWGLRCDSEGSGVALYAVSQGTGTAVSAIGNAAGGSARASLFINPQNKAPSTAFSGDGYISGSSGKLHIYNGTHWESVVNKTFVGGMNTGKLTITNNNTAADQPFHDNYTIAVGDMVVGSIMEIHMAVEALNITDGGDFDLVIYLGGEVIWSNAGWWTPTSASDIAIINTYSRVEEEIGDATLVTSTYSHNSEGATINHYLDVVRNTDQFDFNGTAYLLQPSIVFSVAGTNNQVRLAQFLVKIY